MSSIIIKKIKMTDRKKLNKLETICMGNMFAVDVLNVIYCRLPLAITNCDSLGAKNQNNDLRLCHFDINKKIEEIRSLDEETNNLDYMFESTDDTINRYRRKLYFR